MGEQFLADGLLVGDNARVHRVPESLARAVAAITPECFRIQAELCGPEAALIGLCFHQYEIVEAAPATTDHQTDDFLSPEQRVAAIADILAGIAVRVYKKGGHHAL